MLLLAFCLLVTVVSGVGFRWTDFDPAVLALLLSKHRCHYIRSRFVWCRPLGHSQARAAGDVGGRGVEGRNIVGVCQQARLERSHELPTGVFLRCFSWSVCYFFCVVQVSDALGLPEIKNRQWSIQETSALKGSGLFEGFDWLVTCIKGGEWVIWGDG